MSLKRNYMGTGIALGVGVGLAIGSSLDNTSAGLPIGIGCGLVWAQWMNGCARLKAKKEGAQSDSNQTRFLYTSWLVEDVISYPFCAPIRSVPPRGTRG